MHCDESHPPLRLINHETLGSRGGLRPPRLPLSVSEAHVEYPFGALPSAGGRLQSMVTISRKENVDLNPTGRDASPTEQNLISASQTPPASHWVSQKFCVRDANIGNRETGATAASAINSLPDLETRIKMHQKALLSLRQAQSEFGFSRASFWRFRKRHRICLLPGRRVSAEDILSSFDAERAGRRRNVTSDVTA